MVEPANVKKNVYFWKNYGCYIKEDKENKKSLKQYKEKIQAMFEEKNKMMEEKRKNPVDRLLEKKQEECKKTGREFNLSEIESTHTIDLLSAHFFKQQVVKLFQVKKGR